MTSVKAIEEEMAYPKAENVKNTTDNIKGHVIQKTMFIYVVKRPFLK